MNNIILTISLTVICLLILFKHIRLIKKHKKLLKFLYKYLNSITSARYGNLNLKIDEGFDSLTLLLSKDTNALLESILDRDIMIKEYVEREKESQKIKQDFTSCLAHDLKVPIIAQNNTYDLFLNENFGKLQKNQKNAIENLKISNNDLNNMVLNLLDAYKLENNNYELLKEKVELNKLINEIIKQNESILKIQNKEIVFNSNQKEITYNLDKFLFKRALNNLISNAICHSKRSRKIKIELIKSENNIKISVIDRGDGINEEDIKNIFEKYYTKKFSNLGVGLGLYIVSKITTAHNGTITASNNKDKGANFTITLPLYC